MKLETGHDTNVFETHIDRSSRDYVRFYLRVPVTLWQRPTQKLQADTQTGLTHWPSYTSLVNHTALRLDQRLPGDLRLEVLMAAQHHSLVPFVTEEPIEPDYFRTDVELRLSRSLHDWQLRAIHLHRRLNVKPPSAYQATDVSWELRAQHRISRRVSYQMGWKAQDLHYQLWSTETDADVSATYAEIRETSHEWRLNAQIQYLGLWNPFIAYEQTTRTLNEYSAFLFGVIGGVLLDPNWSLQLYVHRRTRPEQPLNASGGQTQQEFLPERQQATSVLSLRRQISEAHSVDLRWRWERDLTSDSQVYIKHVMSLAYSYLF